MVLALGVALKLGRIKVNLTQASRAVPPGFIVEMRRTGMATLASGGHGSGAHFVAEFDDRNEAVAARAIPLLRSWVRACSE
jgi:hypothetical protein